MWLPHREHIDMFGFLQKNVNALDILIEDAKITLQGWGSQPPTFMLCNSKLTMQVRYAGLLPCRLAAMHIGHMLSPRVPGQGSLPEGS